MVRRIERHLRRRGLLRTFEDGEPSADGDAEDNLAASAVSGQTPPAGLDPGGREALLRYVRRPPLAQDRLEHRPGGLVRITLKRAYADGTVAVDMDPLSLLCRLAASVPPPRFHTVKYAGVLAPASPWRSRVAPQASADPTETSPEPTSGEPTAPERTGTYRPWAELLMRTFAVDVLECPRCRDA